MGTKNSQTTQTSTPSQQALDAYNYAANVAKEAAALPLQQYSGPRVAGFSNDQQAAFNTVENAQGVQTPYINAASQYAAQGAAPISSVPSVGTNNVQYDPYQAASFNASDLAQYYNPYQQNVIDATLANINQNNSIQQNQLLGNAIQSGASPFGGDRAGIAAAELARNQALASNQTIADLQNQGFQTALSAYQAQLGQQNQAGLANAANQLSASQGNAANTLAASGQNAANYLNAAQNNAARASNAAEQFAGLGNQAQQQALTGASALLQTGNLQQQLAQQQLDIPYQDFLAQQQYPQQQASALLNAINGNPVNLGSTTTETQPSGNSLTSLLGGLAALGGLFFKEGGAVEPEPPYMGGLAGLPGFDSGGPIDSDFGTLSIPTATAFTPPMFSGIAPTFSTGVESGYGFTVPALNPGAFQVNTPHTDWTWSGGIEPTSSVPSYINALPQISPDAMPAPRSYALPSGLLAAINDLPTLTLKRGGYAHGGLTIDDTDYDPMPLGDVNAVRASGLEVQPDAATNVPMASVAPDMPAMPQSGTTNDMPVDGIASAPAISDDTPSGFAALMSGSAEMADQYLASPKSALLEAGLSMMASKSPFVLQGVGEGALAGVQSYRKAREAASELDAHPVVDDSGPTVRVYYPSEKKWVDTGIPTAKALEMKKPIEVNGHLVDPTDYHEIADYSKAAAPTADIQNFEYARDNGYTGSFAQFQTDMKKAGATQVNTGPDGVDYGKPAEGLVWSRNQDGSVKLDDRGAPVAVPYQGGPAWQQAQSDADKAAAQAGQKTTGANIVVQDIDRILSAIQNDPTATTGIGAALTQNIPGTPAYNVKALADTIRSNTGFDKLQAMRNASPTGGALGQVSDRENLMLQSAIGNLELSQDAQQLMDNLRRVKNIYLDIINGPGNGPAREPLSFEQQPKKIDGITVEPVE